MHAYHMHIPYICILLSIYPLSLNYPLDAIFLSTNVNFEQHKPTTVGKFIKAARRDVAKG